MHIEIQVALNFVISYLYNKLPRRRVNIFGEELEKTLKERFQGHWYPDKPFKGSAFRCLRTGEPTDAVLDRAARESGVPIADILENLPQEMAVWVDPGEVSYRVGEKGTVKILYSEIKNVHDDHCADREVIKTFNPEAPCFRPIDAVSNSMNALSLSPKRSPQGSPPNNNANNIGNSINGNGHNSGILPIIGSVGVGNGNAASFGQQQVQHQQMLQQQPQQHHHHHHQQQQQHQQQQHQQQHQPPLQNQQPHHHNGNHQQQNHHHHHNHHVCKSGGANNGSVVHNNAMVQNGSNNLIVNNGGNSGTSANGGTSSSVVGTPVSKQMGATSPAPSSGTSNSGNASGGSGSAAFLPRSQAPLTFTTATFAQTKFGSTKLKTSSKRANGNNMLTALAIPRSRMSPTEFSNYIKQRAMQQQQQQIVGGNHHHGGGGNNNNNNHSQHGLCVQSVGNQLGPIGSISPARSISPNPLAVAAQLAAAASVGGHHSPSDPSAYYFGANNANTAASVNNINSGISNNNIGVSSATMSALYPPPFGSGSSSAPIVNGGSGIRGCSSSIFDGAFDNIYGIGALNNKFQSQLSNASAASNVTGFQEPLQHNSFYNNGLNVGGLGAVGTGVNMGNNNIGNNAAAAGSFLNGLGNNSGSNGIAPHNLAVGSAVMSVSASTAIGNNNNIIGNNTQSQSSQSSGDSSPASGGSSNSSTSSNASAATDGAKLLDGLNAFYTGSGQYQHLLVAN